MSRRGELVSAAGWALAGVVIVAASWRMDRLDDRGINPWSVPGLTPGIVGALMLVLALVLALQAWGSAASPPGGAPPEPADRAAAPAPGHGARRRTLLALALCVGFAVLAPGRGLPFVVDSALFVFVFATLFGWAGWRAERRVARGLALALTVALAASVLIAWLFESVFLVRLP